MYVVERTLKLIMEAIGTSYGFDHLQRFILNSLIDVKKLSPVFQRSYMYQLLVPTINQETINFDAWALFLDLLKCGLVTLNV